MTMFAVLMLTLLVITVVSNVVAICCMVSVHRSRERSHRKMMQDYFGRTGADDGR